MLLPKSYEPMLAREVVLYPGEGTMSALDGEEAKEKSLQDQRQRQRRFLKRSADHQGPRIQDQWRLRVNLCSSALSVHMKACE